MRRPNRATIKDESLEDSFRQGFVEGLAVIDQEWAYALTLYFEGRKLRQVHAQTYESAMTYLEEHLRNGPGTSATIEVVTDQKQEAEIIAGGENENVIEGEVVEE